MKAAKKRILEVASDFEKLSEGNTDSSEEYKMEDAGSGRRRYRLVCRYRKSVGGRPAKKGGAGLIKIRVFRPFPMEELSKALSKVKSGGRNG